MKWWIKWCDLMLRIQFNFPWKLFPGLTMMCWGGLYQTWTNTGAHRLFFPLYYTVIWLHLLHDCSLLDVTRTAFQIMKSWVVGIYAAGRRHEPLPGGDCVRSITALEYMPMLSVKGINHQRQLVGDIVLGWVKKNFEKRLLEFNRLLSICMFKIMITVALCNF